ncbi:MAG: sensor histidine kinase [Myxococcales bacterium]
MLPITPGLHQRPQFVGVEELLDEGVPSAPRAGLDAQQRLLAIVGHDLRNPLQTITGSISLLRRQPGLTPSAVASLDRMERSAERMARLIRDLLDCSAQERGGMPLFRTCADVHAVSRECVEECRAAHPSRTIVLETSGIGTAALDPGRVEQALTNLIVNAIEHGGDGPVRVESVGTATHAVALKVHNGGPAIPADLLPELFQPFHRHAPGGLGLGLYIVAQIAAAHGGSVSAESSEGSGTTFTLQLPRR